ncbi:acid-sensing ion channel 1B isoform X2 [Silurus meridionalis]|nr:acid-sensing ion channel 1B isoform X2 [Silurus meridionalis]
MDKAAIVLVKSGTDLGEVMRPGVQSAFQFIPKVFSKFEFGVTVVLQKHRYEIRDTHLVEESVLETLRVKADFLTFKPRPFNMREFYDRTGHDIKEMLLSCYYRGEKCSAEDFKVGAEAFPRTQQRKESIVGMAEVLHNFPGSGPAPRAVDVLQVRELGVDVTEFYLKVDESRTGSVGSVLCNQFPRDIVMDSIKKASGLNSI